MPYEDVLTVYESVAEVTNKMLLAARAQDWDKLTELESSCSEYVAQIQKCEEPEPMSGDAYLRKLSSIKVILANDREIRNLMAPWMMKLNSMLSTSRKSI